MAHTLADLFEHQYVLVRSPRWCPGPAKIELAGSPLVLLTCAIEVPSYPRSPATSAAASMIRRRDSRPLARVRLPVDPVGFPAIRSPAPCVRRLIANRPGSDLP